MADWTLTIERYSVDGSGNGSRVVQAFVTTASSVEMTFPLNSPSEVSLSIAHNSQEANAVYSLLSTTLPCLRVSRNGTGVFFGVMTSCESSLEEDATMNLTFTDWIGTWQNINQSTLSTYAIDEPLDNIVNNTVGFLQLLANGFYTVKHLGYKDSAGAMSTNIGAAATNYTENLKSFGKDSLLYDAMQALVAQDDPYGADWYCDVDPTTGKCRLTIGRSLGSDKSATIAFAYGPNVLANVTSVQTTYLPPVNRVVCAENNDGGYSSATDSTSIDSYGEFAVIADPQPNGFVGIQRNQAMLRTAPRQAVMLTANATLAPAPWTDYWLGDTVKVVVQRDSLNIDGNYRVNQVSISLDDNLIDTGHNLTFEVK